MGSLLYWKELSYLEKNGTYNRNSTDGNWTWKKSHPLTNFYPVP